MSAPARELRTTAGALALGGAPWLMGIVNASPESFSDGAQIGSLDDQVTRARELVAAGACIIDVGGESGVTNVATVGARTEIERVVPLVERLAAEGILVSVDTFTAEVADAAVAAGAAIVNDVSGLRDEGLPEVCARTGAGLVITHTRAEPKTKVLDHDYGSGVVEDVVDFLGERMDVAAGHGVAPEQVLLDPGPDFAKSPAQTIEVLRDLSALHELGRPLLLAASRKDFVGALTRRRPRERLAGTLAAFAHGMDHGAHVFRVHDVSAMADFVAVREALRGEAPVPEDLALAEELRREA